MVGALILTRRPSRVTASLISACDAKGLSATPALLSIEPTPGALPNKCIHNVQHAVASQGGEVVLGWKLLHWPKVLVQFIGHAVIRQNGRLLCITPDSHGDTKVLFAADEFLTFDFSNPHARMPSSWHATDQHTDTLAFIKVQEDLRTLKLKAPPTSGLIKMYGPDATTLQQLEHQQRRLIRDIALRVLGSKDPCICDAGRSFGVCCQPGMRSEQRSDRGV